MSQKQCQECGQSFEPKRADQKFCAPKCKNKFNNRSQKERFQGIKLVNPICVEINEILMQNREILKKFVGQIIQLRTLRQKGFKEDYFTNIQHFVDDEKIKYICYDYAFHFLSEEERLIQVEYLTYVRLYISFDD
jgi:predicted RNA-binding Zn-ribbon protein involved in translation (DUF1610 family)